MNNLGSIKKNPNKSWKKKIKTARSSKKFSSEENRIVIWKFCKYVKETCFSTTLHFSIIS